MAVIHTDQISIGSQTCAYADLFYTIGSKYSNKFSHEIGSNILTFDGDCQIYFNNNVVGIKKGDDVLYNIASSLEMGYDPKYLETLFTDNTFIFRMKWNRWGDWYRNFFVLTSKNGKKFLGINTTTSNNPAVDVYCTFVDMVTGTDGAYGIQRILNTGNQIISPNLIFSDTSIIVSTSGNYALMPDFKSCSNVTVGSTISANGKNYWAIGNNTLIEVDAE